MYTHVLKNAMVPLIRNIPTVFIASIIGSYFVEMIWLIPGTGNLMVSALRAPRPNVPIIQGLTVVYSLLSMSAFLLGDIATALYDPRIKLESKKGDN
jgi:oligopeptide transport system permease protein